MTVNALSIVEKTLSILILSVVVLSFSLALPVRQPVIISLGVDQSVDQSAEVVEVNAPGLAQIQSLNSPCLMSVDPISETVWRLRWSTAPTCQSKPWSSS